MDSTNNVIKKCCKSNLKQCFHLNSIIDDAVLTLSSTYDCNIMTKQLDILFKTYNNHNIYDNSQVNILILQVVQPILNMRCWST
jgi:hypothetical protein